MKDQIKQRALENIQNNLRLLRDTEIITQQRYREILSYVNSEVECPHCFIEEDDSVESQTITGISEAKMRFNYGK